MTPRSARPFLLRDALRELSEDDAAAMKMMFTEWANWHGQARGWGIGAPFDCVAEWRRRAGEEPENDGAYRTAAAAWIRPEQVAAAAARAAGEPEPTVRRYLLADALREQFEETVRNLCPLPRTAAEVLAALKARMFPHAADVDDSREYVGARAIGPRLRDPQGPYNCAMSADRLKKAIRRAGLETRRGKRGKLTVVATEAQVAEIARALRGTVGAERLSPKR